MAQARTTTMTESIMDNAKKFGDELLGWGANVLHAGMGVVATTEEQARDTYSRMVDKGKTYGAQDDRLFRRAAREARDVGRELERRVENTVTATLNRVGVPSRDEINQLSHRVDTLIHKVDALAAKE